MPRRLGLTFLLLLLPTPILAQTAELADSPLIRDLFAAKCLHCHDSEGRLPFLTDEAKIDSRYIGKNSLRPLVVPGDLDHSLIYQIIQVGAQNRMPKDGDFLSPNEIALVRQWILGDPEPTDNSNPLNCPGAATFTLDELAKIAQQDLDRLTSDANEKRFYRYFMAPSAVGCAVTANQFWGLVTFLLNSLSFGNRVVPVAPLPSMPEILARIDLRDYGATWLPDSDRFQNGQTFGNWDQVLAPRYPYPDREREANPAARKLAKAVKSSVPLLRADWFINVVMQPTVYYALMRIPKDARSLDAWVTQNLLAAPMSDLLQRQAHLRGGITVSGVSTQNRIYERLPGLFGGVWQSYDFAPQTFAEGKLDTSKDVLSEPLRPSYDAKEIIFQLRNGLFGYLITNANNERAETAPSLIVRDHVRGTDIAAGTSCLSCHMHQGLIPKSDKVAAFWQRAHGGDRNTDTYRAIMAIFNPRRLLKLLQTDNQNYVDAFEQTGATRESLDLYFNLIDDYRGAMGRERVLREIGSDEAAYAAAFSDVAPANKAVLEFRARLEDGGMTRNFFEFAYPEVLLFQRGKLALATTPAATKAPEAKPSDVKSAPVRSGGGGGVVFDNF